MSRLNFGQANAVSSALVGIDEFITDVRAVLNAKDGAHLLRYDNVPDASEHRAIEVILDALIDELRRTQQILALQIPPVDVRKKIKHESALLAAELADMKSSSLKRYGKVDPAVAPKLDTAVERITSFLRQLSGK
jgi:hypothetical protein